MCARTAKRPRNKMSPKGNKSALNDYGRISLPSIDNTGRKSNLQVFTNSAISQ